MKSDFSGQRFSPTWCVLPWIHAATLTDGSTQLCCVAEKTSDVNLNQKTLSDYWNSNYTKQARVQMLEGAPVAACRRCYEEEKNGLRSHRVIENKAWHEKIGFDKIDQIVLKTDADGALAEEVLSVDMRLGNTCNLQCIMCQPRESSKWKSLSEKLLLQLESPALKGEWQAKRNIDFKLYEWYKNPLFWKNLEQLLPYTREIIIAGGEPMLIKEHLEFIKRCSKTEHAKHIHVRYHTNIMELPADMRSVWEKFERVEIFASVDGMDHIANYIRHPSDWSKVKINLDIIDQMPDNTWLRFLFSVQALNIHELPNFIRWIVARKYIKQNAFSTLQAFIHPGLVHWPDYLNPKILPKHIKAKITQDFTDLYNELGQPPFDKYNGIISFMNSEDWSDKLPLLKDYLTALDVSRGTDRMKVFGEYLGEYL